jgi:hypothetical protein
MCGLNKNEGSTPFYERFKRERQQLEVTLLGLLREEKENPDVDPVPRPMSAQGIPLMRGYHLP